MSDNSEKITLIDAIKEGNLDKTKELLKDKNIKDSINTYNPRDYMTPLTYAIQNNSIGEPNSLEIVKELLKNENIDINLKDNGRRTPLRIAVETRNLDVVKELLKQDKIEIDEDLINYAIRNGVERGKNFFEKRESENDKKIDNFRQIACLLIEDKRVTLK